MPCDEAMRRHHARSRAGEAEKISAQLVGTGLAPDGLHKSCNARIWLQGGEHVEGELVDTILRYTT